VPCVYILRSGEDDLFKIGRAADLEKRMKHLATGNPHPLTLYAEIETEHASDCEAYFHHRLQSKRSTRSDATEFFEVDPAHLDELIDEVRVHNDEFLPRRAAAEHLAEEQNDDRMLEPGEVERGLYRRLLEVREQRDTLNFECVRLETELKLAIGTAAGMEGIATWKAHSMKRFDQEAFGVEYPDLYEAFKRESLARSFRLL
jgi:hypothetical protein